MMSLIIEVMPSADAPWAPSTATPWVWRVLNGQNTTSGIGRTEKEARARAEAIQRKMKNFYTDGLPFAVDNKSFGRQPFSANSIALRVNS